MLAAVVTTAVVAAAIAVSFRPEYADTWVFWVALVVPYAGLSGFAVYRMHDDGVLKERLTFRRGDITIGVLLGGALLLVAWLFRNFVLPVGSPQVAWIFRILLQLGNAQVEPMLALLIVLVAVMEELVWRGLVQNSLAERIGTKHGFWLGALLYALAHGATVHTLSDRLAGPNPLLVLAALGCGLAWGFTASKLGRLPPVMISHIAFSYFVPAVVLPRL
jgi:membrane protease YdiL (CAAX protease family)